MNKGHLDAQNYRFDFAEVVVGEMLGETGEKQVDHDAIYEKYQKGEL